MAEVESLIGRALARLGDFSPFEVRVVETVGVLLLLMLLRGLLLVVVARQTDDARRRYHWRKGITYAVALIGIFLAGRLWFPGFRSVATFLGLVAAGLVISLKEPLSNLAAWLFMLWRRPFVIGDRIQVGEYRGDVIDRRLFQFSLLEIGGWIDADQSTGRVLHVPNGRVFIDAVANHSRGFPYIWDELHVTVTFESNWRAAKELLLAAGERHGRAVSAEAESRVLTESQRFMIFYSTLAPTVYTKAGERGIELALRYLCEVRARRGTLHAIWEDILDSFAARDDIDFAYPTRRIFDRDREGRTLKGAELDPR